MTFRSQLYGEEQGWKPDRRELLIRKLLVVG